MSTNLMCSKVSLVAFLYKTNIIINLASLHIDSLNKLTFIYFSLLWLPYLTLSYNHDRTTFDHMIIPTFTLFNEWRQDKLMIISIDVTKIMFNWLLVHWIIFPAKRIGWIRCSLSRKLFFSSIEISVLFT